MSNDSLPRVYLARHGETEWSAAGRHTGRSNLALTTRGEQRARDLGKRLAGLNFDCVLSSPLMRALRTCELAGFGGVARENPNLVEWDYGEYEGRTTKSIQRNRPDWELFRDGCPGGESLVDVSARADRVIAQLRANGGNSLVFSSAHLLRVLAARWCGLDGALGRHLFLDTGSVSILGYDHSLDEPNIRLWNESGR